MRRCPVNRIVVRALELKMYWNWNAGVGIILEYCTWTKNANQRYVLNSNALIVVLLSSGGLSILHHTHCSLHRASQQACKLGCVRSLVVLVSWEIFLWHFGGVGWEPILENCWTHLIIITFFKYCIKALWSGLHRETLVLCPTHVWYSTEVCFKALIWLVELGFIRVGLGLI